MASGRSAVRRAFTLSRSTIEDNGVGLGASSGGQIFSYGDNSFANNASGDGVPPTAIPLK